MIIVFLGVLCGVGIYHVKFLNKRWDANPREISLIGWRDRK